MKPIILTVSKEDYVKKYVQVITHGLITDSELLVIDQFISKYLDLKQDQLPDKYLNKLLFDSETRKVMYNTLGYSYHNFNNYFKALKDKGLIIQAGDEYKINPFILPQESITFKFNVK